MAEDIDQVETASESTPEAQAETNGGSSDLSEIKSFIDQKFESLTAQQQQDRTLAELLADADDDYEYEEPEAEVEPAPQEQEIDPLQRLQALEQWAVQNAQTQAQREQAQAEQEVNALADKYPDFYDHLDEVKTRLDPLVDRLGDSVLDNANLIEHIYKGVKADAASAAETPAEEARKRGASLETDAGAGNREGDESDDDQLMDRIASAQGGGSSVFF